MIKRHVSIIEQDIMNFSNTFIDCESFKENSSTLIKGNSLCQQGLFSVLKYVANKIDFSSWDNENILELNQRTGKEL